MTPLVDAAPGKVNLCLFLGPTRADGLHTLVSVVQAVSLADELRLEAAPVGASGDEVVCDGVAGPNLAAAALAAYREQTGWDGPPVRLTIVKRVPVAAGMGGGSSDAAAALRLIDRWVGRDRSLAAHGPARAAALRAIAPRLGADVPALLEPGPALVGGAGEEVVALAPLSPMSILVLPSTERLSTPDVFREADRLGLGRSDAELAERRAAVQTALRSAGALPADLLHNDLEPAARSLCPSIGAALEAALEAGAVRAMVSGSGPTVFGLLPDGPGDALEPRAAALADRYPGAAVVRPWAGAIPDGP